MVFDRPRDSEDRGAFCGERWEVERSRLVCRSAGGLGARQRDVGPADTDDFDIGGKGFVGGGGAAC